MEDSDEKFDPPLTARQQALVEKLTVGDVALIDQTLLSSAAKQWRKVAFVIGSSMPGLEDKAVGVPDIYYAQRILELVNRGVLESQGDLRRMRFCEVRIHNAG